MPRKTAAKHLKKIKNYPFWILGVVLLFLALIFFTGNKSMINLYSIYQQRNELQEADEIGDTIAEMREDVFNDIISQFIPPGSIDEQWDAAGLETALEGEFGLEVPVQEWIEKESEINEEVIRERVLEIVDKHFKEKEEVTGEEVMRHFEKALMLNVLDQKWKEHLASMDYLRQGIGLRGYAQKQPMQEYKRESFEMFTGLLESIKHEVIRVLARVRVTAEEDVEAIDKQRRQQAPMQFKHEEARSATQGAAPQGQAGQPGQAADATPETFVREGRKVGRNEPCPCGSGQKYKHCHGKLT